MGRSYFQIETELAAKNMSEKFGEKWFSFFGSKRSAIVAALGESVVNKENYLIYRFSDGVRIGEISFLCYPFHEDRCSQIEVHWQP